MILADYNGGDPTVFSIYAAPDERWAINFTSFKDITLTDFEAVDESSLMINEDSGQALVAQPGSGNLSLEVWIIAVACTIILTISYGRILLKKRSRQTLANRKTSAKKTVHHEPAKPFITEETIPAVAAEKGGAKKSTGSQTLLDLKASVKKTARHFMKQPQITEATIPTVPAEKGGTKKSTGSQTLPDLKDAVKKTARHFTKQPQITEETIPAVPAEKGSEKKSARSPVSRHRVVVVEDHSTRPAENKKISHDQVPSSDAIRRRSKSTGSEEEINDTTADSPSIRRKE